MVWMTVLGIPAAVYVMSVVALLFYVNEKSQNPLLLLGAGVLTSGLYIFHRVAIQPIEPMQNRHRFAIQHKKKLHTVSFLLCTLAIAIFALHHPLASLLVFGALAGVITYGRTTIVRPLRMYAFVKPIAVGCAIVLLGWVLNSCSNSLTTVLAFSLICSADAMMCDLPDRSYDQATGCQTLAANLGFNWTWGIATIVYCVASLGLLYAYEHVTIGFYLFVVFVASLTFRKFDPRFLVDFRLLLVLLLAWDEWMFWTGQLQS